MWRKKAPYSRAKKKIYEIFEIGVRKRAIFTLILPLV